MDFPKRKSPRIPGFDYSSVNYYFVTICTYDKLAVTDDSMNADISVVLGQYKMSVTKKIRKTKPGFLVWQRSYHDHVIRNQSGYEKIWTYIDSNPQKWEEDCFYMSASRNASQREGR